MLQSQVRSTQFADFLCNKVLPAFGSFDAPIQAQMLKLLAEVCMFTGTLEKPLEATQAIYKLLMVRIWTILINWSYFNKEVTTQDFPIFFILVRFRISQLLILFFFIKLNYFEFIEIFEKNKPESFQPSKASQTFQYFKK